MQVVLFWFRRDLRLHDNAGLHAALSSGLPVVPVFIFDSEILSQLEDKDDKRVSFIYKVLEEMQKKPVAIGSTLDVRYGKPLDILKQLQTTYDVKAIYTNHDYEPYAKERDRQISEFFVAQNISFFTYKDQVIFEKSEVTKADGKPYMMYSPYAKKWKSILEKKDYKAYPSEQLLQNLYKQKQRPLPSLQSMGFQYNEAIPKVKDADTEIIQHYHATRNIPSVQGTTRMGVHLRFGTISVRQLVAKAIRLNETYLGELIWRDFFMQILWHQPRVVNEACKKEYDQIEWRNNEEEFDRWCEGKTGYSIVDAGMRELNATGFMHNRVRMIAASFLVKDLLIDWRWGEAYFARKLLDYELSSNNGNWQWVAGCGCDAAPYFRVFNPSTQAKKFDGKEVYIKKWVPEYGTTDYPSLMVDHAAAKEQALAAYKKAVQKKYQAG